MEYNLLILIGIACCFGICLAYNSRSSAPFAAAIVGLLLTIVLLFA